MKSPISYLGGKSRLVRTILPMIPSDHVCYCEPFCGAAWVLFGKERSKVEVINDRDGELVTFWRVVQNHLEEFLRYFRFAVTSRLIFELEKKKDPDTLTDIQRSCRYYYVQRAAFGGKTTGRTFGTSATRAPNLNISAIEETLLHVHWRLSNVVIEHLDACECIRRYDRPSTFLYVDPPYYGTSGYSTPFLHDDYVKLADVLRTVRSRFLLSINDVPPVRTIFNGFHFRKVTTTYSITNPRTSLRSKMTGRRELIVSNFPSTATRAH